MRSLVAVFVAPAVRAADPPPAPDAAARAAATAPYEAGRRKDWAAYAKAILPDDLKAFRDAWVPMLEAHKKSEPERRQMVVAQFAGATDLAGVLADTPERFLARLLESTNRGQIYNSPVTETAAVLGLVAEGPDQAHAVVRVTRKWADTTNTVVEVVTVRKAADGWKAELPQPLKLLGVAMRASVSARDPEPASATATAEDPPRPVEERPRPKP